MSTLTYTLPQLQEALQETSAEAARNRITLLEKKHGFPPRLPGFTARWSRPAVDRWFAGWGRAEEEQQMGGTDAGIVLLHDTLERAYG